MSEADFLWPLGAQDANNDEAKYFVAFALYLRFVVVLISSILHSRQVSEPVGLFHFEELIS